jgi:hypothetical protein
VGRNITGSTWLRDLALERGYPRKSANRMDEYDPQTGELKTTVQIAREFEHWNLRRLRWLLDFAQGPERWINPNQRENLNRGLRLFMGETPKALPGRGALEKLASYVREGLFRLVVDRRASWEVKLTSGGLTRRLDYMKDYILDQYSASNWQTAFLLRTTDLLVSHGARIKQCAMRGCGRLFVPTKRQAYCSTACSLKTRQQRFRASHSGEELSERRHEHYRNEVKRSKGSGAAKHVKRRPSRNAAEIAKESASQKKGEEDGTV